MAYIEQQLVAHKDRIWHLPAIALGDFSIIVLPSDEVLKGCDSYQVLHSKTGMYLMSFSVAEVAIECLEELGRRSLLIDVSGDPRRMSFTTREGLWEVDNLPRFT